MRSHEASAAPASTAINQRCATDTAVEGDEIGDVEQPTRSRATRHEIVRLLRKGLSSLPNNCPDGSVCALVLFLFDASVEDFERQNPNARATKNDLFWQTDVSRWRSTTATKVKTRARKGDIGSQKGLRGTGSGYRTYTRAPPLVQTHCTVD